MRTKLVGTISDRAIFVLGMFFVISALLSPELGDMVLTSILILGGAIIMGFAAEEGSLMESMGNASIGIILLAFTAFVLLLLLKTGLHGLDGMIKFV